MSMSENEDKTERECTVDATGRTNKTVADTDMCTKSSQKSARSVTKPLTRSGIQGGPLIPGKMREADILAGSSLELFVWGFVCL